MAKIEKTDEQWRQELTPEQYHVLRRKGTEPPFTGEYDHVFEPGTYVCAGCGNPLFPSGTKFESGTGWPSFEQPISDAAVAYILDDSHGMRRVETVCNACKAHLGHVFPDGPPPSGLRYCMNALALAKIGH